MKNRVILLCCLLLCVGCAPAPTSTMNIGGADENNHRVSVRRIDVIEDWVAYQGRRGIYIITDTETGKEYIGVSGIGISETGIHKSGKSSAGDER